QQGRAQSYTFPSDKHHHEVRAQYQHEHHEHKQIQVGKKPVKTRFAVHITDGENVDQETNSGDGQNHRAGSSIKLKLPVDVQPIFKVVSPSLTDRTDGVSTGNPGVFEPFGEKWPVFVRGTKRILDESADGDDKRKTHGS